MYLYIHNKIMKRVDLYLKEEQIKKLQELKELNGIPVSESVRRAIDKYLESILEEDSNGNN